MATTTPVVLVVGTDNNPPTKKRKIVSEGDNRGESASRFLKTTGTEEQEAQSEAKKKARKEQREAASAAKRAEKQKAQEKRRAQKEKQRTKMLARQEMQRRATMAENAAKRARQVAVREASRKQQAALPGTLKKEKRPLPNHNSSSGLLTTPKVICAQLGLELWDTLLTADVWGLIGEYVEFGAGTLIVKRKLRASWSTPSQWDEVTGLAMLCVGGNWSSVFSLRYHMLTVLAAKPQLADVAGRRMPALVPLPTVAQQTLVQQRLAAWRQHCRTLPKNAVFNGRIQLQSDQLSRYRRGPPDWVRWHEGRRLGAPPNKKTKKNQHDEQPATSYYELYDEARHGALCHLPDTPL